jgi:hypothetical protein
VPHLHRDATFVPGPGSPLPHLHRDRAHRCHICIGTGLTATTSALGPGSPLPHLHRDWVHKSPRAIFIVRPLFPNIWPHLVHNVQCTHVSHNRRRTAACSVTHFRHVGYCCCPMLEPHAVEPRTRRRHARVCVLVEPRQSAEVFVCLFVCLFAE